MMSSASADAVREVREKGKDVVRELLDAGRPEREIEQVAGGDAGDTARWVNGAGTPTEQQLIRLRRWREALAVGLEAATGRDARHTLPVTAPGSRP